MMGGSSSPPPQLVEEDTPAIVLLLDADQFIASSRALSANQYTEHGFRPVKLYVAAVPPASGTGCVATGVAEAKFAPVISADEYRKSYAAAVPVAPSSPGEVHVSRIVVSP